MQRIAYILFAISLSFNGFGQACFFADDTVGCIPFTVHLTNCGNQNTAIIYYLGDDVSSCNFNGRDCDDTTFTFTETGTYSITQVPSGGSKLTKTNYIRAVDDPVPQFSVATCEDGDVFISIDENIYDHYEIDYGDGSLKDTIEPLSTVIKTYSSTTPKTITVTGFYDYTSCNNSNSSIVTPVISLIQKPGLTFVEGTSATSSEVYFTGENHLMYYTTISDGPSGFKSNSPSFMISGTDTLINFNSVNESTCYQVTNFDACGNDIKSDLICSIGLNAMAVNNQNNIDWDSYPTADLDEFTLFRNDVGIVQGTGTSYTDLDVQCAREYCYFQRAQLNQTINGQPIYYQTPEICVTSFSTDTPPAIQQLIVSINSNNYTELKWSNPIGWDTNESFAPARFSLEYGNDTMDYFGTLNSEYADFPTSISFINAQTEVGCYRLNYTDACDNESNTEDGPQACAILLSGTRLQTGGYSLSWTKHLGFSDQSENYSLEWLDEDGLAFQNITLGYQTSFVDLTPPSTVQKLRYRIKATSGNAEITYSNIVSFDQRAVVFFPTGFSPNGDGQNDEFKPVGLFVQSYDMTIFNRWGETLFFTDNIDAGWDGTFLGEKVINGVYVYKTNYTDQNGTKTTRKGTIAVIY